MLSFIAKVATYLDKYGYSKLADELDIFIQKNGQAYPDPIPYPEAYEVSSTSGEVQRTSTLINEIYNQMYDMFNKINLQAKGDTGVDSKELARELTPKWENVVNTIEKENVQLPNKEQWRQVQLTVARQLLNVLKSNNPEEMPDMFAAAADALRWLLTTLNPVKQKAEETAGVASKMPAKKAPRKNSLIIGIQSMLGLSGKDLTGLWNTKTNNLFINYMNSRHPTFMQNNRFTGTLKDAYELMKNDALTVPQKTTQPEKQVEPAQERAPKWTSTYYDLSRPETMAALERLDEAHKNDPRYEDGQTMIDTIERQALAGAQKVHKSNQPHDYITQSLFEEMLKEKTRPSGRTLPLR